MAMATRAKRTTNRRGAPKRRKARRQCFTIMPFGGWFDEYYETVFRPAVEAAGLEPHRADDLYRPSAIVNDIWAYTKRASVLLADMTGKNPNVFYELGLAHALAKPVILVAESIEDVPFDLRALRVILYDKNSPRWGETLAEQIRAAISEVLTSPVTAVLPTFLQTTDVERPTVSRHDKELLQIRQELDIIKRSIRSVAGGQPGPQQAGARAGLLQDSPVPASLGPRVISAEERPMDIDRVMELVRATFPTTMKSSEMAD